MQFLKYSSVCASLCISLLILISGLRADTPERNPPGSTNPIREDLIHALVERVNQRRIKAGQLPLKINSTLNQASTNHARDMATEDYFAFRTPDGKSSVAYCQKAGYGSNVGQHLYQGRWNPDEIVQRWAVSGENRENLLFPNCRETGIGLATTREPDRFIVVRTYGERTDVYPVVINGEAWKTVTPKVTLYLHGEGRMERMRFSKNGTDFSDWEPFRPVRSWTLDPKAGKQTVYAEMWDGFRTYMAFDEIQFLPPSDPQTATKPVK